MAVMLGSLAGMVRLSCPSEEIHDEDLGVTVVQTGAGAYSMSPARRGLRSWRLSTSVADPFELAAATSVIRYSSYPLVFVSEHAAGINGLTPGQSAFVQDYLPSGVSRGGAEWVSDQWGDWQVAWSANTDLTTIWRVLGPAAPVVPGQPLTVSAGLRSMSGQTPRIGINWVDAAGVASNGPRFNVSASASAPLARRSVTTTAPLTAVGAWLLFSGVSQVAAPAITLTPELRPYGEGDGAPEVVPLSTSQAPHLITAGATFGSHDLVLQEVGLAVR